jgi:hypothetical protein
MRIEKSHFLLLFIVTLILNSANAGILSGAICSAGCAAVVVACYSAAGAVFGTVTAGAGTPAAILACNAAFGKCMAACAAATVVPIP